MDYVKRGVCLKYNRHDLTDMKVKQSDSWMIIHGSILSAFNKHKFLSVITLCDIQNVVMSGSAHICDYVLQIC